MKDDLIVAMFQAAWQGLRTLPKWPRARDYYLSRLREAPTAEASRSLLAEFCAEGGLAYGGLGQWIGEEDTFLDFWRDLNSARWQTVRDLALLALATLPPKEPEP